MKKKIKSKCELPYHQAEGRESLKLPFYKLSIEKIMTFCLKSICYNKKNTKTHTQTHKHTV